MTDTLPSHLEPDIQFTDWLPRDQWASGSQKEEAIREELLKIYRNRGEVVTALAANGRVRFIVKYPKRPPSNTLFNIHELLRQLEAITADSLKKYPASVHVQHISDSTFAHVEHLTKCLKPEHHSAHILTAQEVAALVLRAYDLGLKYREAPDDRAV